MALKQVLIGKRLGELRAQLEGENEKRDALALRRQEMQRREEELETAVNEVTEETSQEDREALEALTGEWEQDEAVLSGEENANAQAREEIEKKITELEAELAEINSRAAKKPAAREERKEEKIMNNRKFFGMNHQERDAFFAHEDVKTFIANVRTAIKEKRGLTGGEYIIPTQVLDLIRERVEEYSKLIKHVNVQRIKGAGRVPVMGVVPEAVWTEMCARLNEIDLSFGQVELDGYKVGAYIAVCNAVLEDNDVELATKVIESLGKALGIAVDKAILYGAGTRMPTGILTALAADEDLAASNILAISGKSGIELFQAIIEATGAADNEYAVGGMFFAMNRKTKTKLVSEAMSFNAGGAIVSGVAGEMPVIGGKIEELGFIPDNVVICGYGELYAMIERAGMKFGRSEEVHFVEDETVFKATARYDGKPAVAKAFVAFSIAGVKPAATDVTFANPDA